LALPEVAAASASEYDPTLTPTTLSTSAMPYLLTRPSPGTTSEGVYVAVACARTGLWTDPTGGACTNSSDSASFLCAYGGGDACVTCPTGALCPGGSRLWNRAGHWVASEAARAVSRCAPPDPRVSVESGIFPRRSRAVWGRIPPRFVPLRSLCAGLLPLRRWYVRALSGNSEHVGPLRRPDRVSRRRACCSVRRWSPACGRRTDARRHPRGQCLPVPRPRAVVHRSAADRFSSSPASARSLPPQLASLFRGLAVLQLEGVLLPPSCTGAYAFESQGWGHGCSPVARPRVPVRAVA